MAPEADLAAMRRAVALAAATVHPTSPNPVAGAVLLGADGRELAAAVSGPRGAAHAEIAALAAAGAAARGATAVVTLEPCNAAGRTGACTDALIAAGVARVVYAVADPMPPYAGGHEALRAAGIDVLGGVGAAEAEPTLRPWLDAARAARPFVTWKYAATLDGRTAAADGTSRWITGPAARREVHEMRARHDAVAVGVGTVLADDPQLTVRDVDGPNPLRVVFDSAGRTPAGARVRDDAAPTLLLRAADVPGPDGRVDLAGALKLLYDRGVRSLLLEGGARLAGAFVAAGLVDRVVAYLAPALLGAGPAALEQAGVASIAGMHRLRLAGLAQVGADVRLVAHAVRGEG